jgi:hypothetical protein
VGGTGWEEESLAAEPAGQRFSITKIYYEQAEEMSRPIPDAIGAEG